MSWITLERSQCSLSFRYKVASISAAFLCFVRLMLSPFSSRAHVEVCLDFGGALTVRHNADLGFAFDMDFFASDMDFDIDFDFTFDMEFDMDSITNTFGNGVILCGLMILWGNCLCVLDCESNLD